MECIGDIVRVLCREMWGGELWTVCVVFEDIVGVLCRVMWGGGLWIFCGVYWEYRESFV